MVAAKNGFVRDAGLLQDFAEFGVHARVLAFPERAERIFVGIAWGHRRFVGERVVRWLVHQIHVAIGAACEAGAIFGVALWANHGVGEFTTEAGNYAGAECGGAGAIEEGRALREAQDK